MFKQINAKFTPVKDLSEEWLNLRTTGIGGSDAGAILGLNKYASRCSVYLQKKGIENNFKGNEATEWGHLLEEPLRKKLKELYPEIEVETVPGMFTSKDYPFMNASLDGLVFANKEIEIKGEKVQGLGGLEIKTSSSGEGFSDDEIPDSYFAQVQHYMAVTNLDWFILIAFFFNTKKGDVYLIKRNEDFINRLIKEEEDFWVNYVEKNIIPAPTGEVAEKSLIENLEMPSVIELDEDDEVICEKYNSIKEQIKELQKEEDLLKNQILINLYKKNKDLEKSEKTEVYSDSFKITYTTQKRKSVDTDSLKKSGLYEQYTKDTETKVLRITKK